MRGGKERQRERGVIQLAVRYTIGRTTHVERLIIFYFFLSIFVAPTNLHITLSLHYHSASFNLWSAPSSPWISAFSYVFCSFVFSFILRFVSSIALSSYCEENARRTWSWQHFLPLRSSLWEGRGTSESKCFFANSFRPFNFLPVLRDFRRASLEQAYDKLKKGGSKRIR